MEIPDYDGFYFAGVVVCVVCAGLLQYNAAQGKVCESKNSETLRQGVYMCCLMLSSGAISKQLNLHTPAQTGLGKYLSSGPEDKNWEQRQSREAQEQNVKINEANKGSFFASILPKL